LSSSDAHVSGVTVFETVIQGRAVCCATALLRHVTGMTQSRQGCVAIDDITAGMVVANGDIVSRLGAVVFSGSYGFAHQTPIKCFTAVLERVQKNAYCLA
jgi:ABC-type transport system involved in cytochrome c biogenesis ATPase subunit